MLVVLQPNDGTGNRDFTATFNSPLTLTPHAKISLISCILPLKIDSMITIGLGVYDQFIISNTGNPSQTYTVPPGTYDLYSLLSAMNTVIMATPFSNHHTAYFSYDHENNVVVFNVVGDGSANMINHQTTLEPGTSVQNILSLLGLFKGQLTANMFLSINGEGSAPFPEPLPSLYDLRGRSVNISIPSLNISSLFSTGSLRNMTNIIHSVPIDISELSYPLTSYSQALGGIQNDAVFYAYEPTHKESCEINNDGNVILNSLKITLLDNDGLLSSDISISPLNKVSIVVNIDTEHETQSDILRRIKTEKIYDRLSRNFVNYQV